MFSRPIKLIQVSKILLSLSLITSLSLFFPAHPYAQKTIKIGVGLDLTGPLSVFGVNIRHAMRIAIDDINAKGGALGKKVDLLVFDTQSKSKYRLHLLKTAILEKKVDFLIGPFGLRSVSPDFLSKEKSVLHKYKTPMIIFKSNIPYPQPHRYIFQISPDILMQGYAVSNWAGQNTNLKTYVSIGPKVFNDFFTQSVEHLRPNMEDLKDFIPDYKTVDFSPYISHIFQIKPDIIISTLKGIQLEAFLKQSIGKSLFKNIKFIGNFDASFLSRMGDSMINGLYGYTSAPFYALDESRIKSLLHKFKNEKVPYPFDTAIMAYDSIWVLTQAIERAKTADTEKVLDVLIKGGFDSLRGRLEENVPVFIGQTFQSGVFFTKYKFYPMTNVRIIKVADCNDEKCRCDDSSCKRACCKK